MRLNFSAPGGRAFLNTQAAKARAGAFQSPQALVDTFPHPVIRIESLSPEHLEIRFQGGAYSGVSLAPAAQAVAATARFHPPSLGAGMPEVMDPDRKSSRIDLVTSRFLQNNLYVYGRIDEDSALRFQMEMETLMEGYPAGPDGGVPPEAAAQRPIRININSPGGYVSDMTIFLDVMNEAKRRGIILETHVLGEAASAAAIIAANGSHGHRHAAPNARIMIHQPLGGGWGQETDVAIYAKQLKERKNQMIDYLTANTYGRSTRRQVAAALERDHWMTPEEAEEFGVIDYADPALTPPGDESLKNG